MIALTRTSSSDKGTFGYMSMNDSRICFTCEDPWNDNHHGDSCIPEGTYTCVKHESPKFPNTWEVTGVTGRSAILIHNGNTIDDTHGCILVGETLGFVAGKKAVLQSKEALKYLQSILPNQFTLTIKNAYVV